MYSIDGYRTYTDQLVPGMFERWHDPDTTFTVNESSIYRNEMERNCTINENIYKSNDIKTKQHNIGYHLPTMGSYFFIPYFGPTNPPNLSAAPMIWHQPSTTKSNQLIGSYLSSDAIPFIPTKSGSRKLFHI